MRDREGVVKSRAGALFAACPLAGWEDLLEVCSKDAALRRMMVLGIHAVVQEACQDVLPTRRISFGRAKRATSDSGFRDTAKHHRATCATHQIYDPPSRSRPSLKSKQFFEAGSRSSNTTSLCLVLVAVQDCSFRAARGCIQTGPLRQLAEVQQPLQWERAGRCLRLGFVWCCCFLHNCCQSAQYSSIKAYT